ncbi:antibiotic biosynthesis monooxygenase [Embleya sp. NPDC001921]
MIARSWKVWTTVEQAEQVVPYLERTGVGLARATPGNQGAMLLRRPSDGDTVEFWLLTFWECEEAIRAFAGEDNTRAVLYPEDAAYFARADEQVHHFDVVTKE